MKKKKAIIIGAIAAVIIVAVAIVCLVFVFRGEDEEENMNIMDEMGQIEYVEYTYGTRTYVVRKKNNAWLWDHNPLLAAGRELSETRFQTLMQATIDKFERVESLKEYGLDDPFMTITFKDANGNTKIIYIGDMVDEGNSYYATTKGKKNIYLVTDAIVQFVDELDAQREYSEMILEDALTSPTEKRSYDE